MCLYVLSDIFTKYFYKQMKKKRSSTQEKIFIITQKVTINNESCICVANEKNHPYKKGVMLDIVTNMKRYIYSFKN